MGVYNFKDTKTYRKAFELAMEIFAVSKRFPVEERYSLTDQMRRSSRSVCANFGEAYRKKRYPRHFVSKLSDCDAENSETGIWLDFALQCGYISNDLHNQLTVKNAEVGRMLSHMMSHPDRY